MKNTFKVIALGAALAASATLAHATSITGQLSVTGPSVFNYNPTTPSASNVYFPTYGTPTSDFPTVDPYVTNGAGSMSFSGIPALTALDWLLQGLNVPLGSQSMHTPPGGPITIFTGPNGLSFTLDSEGWNESTQVITTNGVSTTYADLNLNGTGMFTLNGFDPTAGTFNFTVQQPVDPVTFAAIACPTTNVPPSTCGGVVTADFSGTGVAVPGAVPEPSSLALLGTSLVGAAMAARRRFARMS